MAGGYGHNLVLRHRYEGRLTSYVVLACIAAASGGLIVGYDIEITDGVSSMDDFVKTFAPKVYIERFNKNNYCQYDNKILQAFTSSVYLAGILASWAASLITEFRGRRPSIVVAGISLMLGTLLNAAAQNMATLVVGRIFLGIGVGFVCQSVPLYLSEMAPSHHRGGLIVMVQLATTLGILSANLVKHWAGKIHPWGWRFSLGLAIIPSMFFTIGGLLLPETPNSLIQRDKYSEGREILEKIRGTVLVDEEYQDLLEASKGAKAGRHRLGILLEKQYRPHLLMAIFLPFSQIATGISVVLLYAPQVVAMMGFGKDASFYSAIIIGLILCISAVVSVVLVDRVGRKIMFYEGGMQMFVCEAAIGVLLKYNLGLYNRLSGPLAGVLLILMNTYVAAFGWSWGSLGWIVPSEMFPLEIRSAGQSLVVSVNFLCTFCMGQVLVTMLCKFQHLTFLFFAGWILIMTSLIWFLLPEFNNVPTEGVVKVWRAHWLWKRFTVPEMT